MSILNSADDLARMDHDHALHPWENFGAADRDDPLILVRGEGVHVWDSRGRQLLDAVGGLWCTNIGLGRKEMARAIAEQAEKLAFTSTFGMMNNDPAVHLAAKLAELAPGDLSHVHLTTGGSTALDSAFRLVEYIQSCRGNPTKRHMIARKHSYHGSTYVAISLGHRDGDRPDLFSYKSDTIHHVSAPYVYRCPDGLTPAQFTDHLVAEFEAKIAEIGPENVGGFFAEPIQASGGILVPPDDYLPRMKAVCERHDILFVADEVVTSFGRLGHWFASKDEFGIQPDMICTAKGLSSAYQPIGAVILSDRLYQDMAEDGTRWFTSGFTYSGHPVACAAALKNIEIIEREGLLAHAADVGAYFGSRLAGLSESPLIGDVRGRGLMWCTEAVADKTTRAKLPPEANVGDRISDAAMAHGVLVRPLGALNVLSPSLILTRDQADTIVDVLEKAVQEVADALVRDGFKVG